MNDPIKVEEPCCIANEGCENPAGWGVNGAIANNSHLRKIPLCRRCGDPVCESKGCSEVVQYIGEQSRLCWYCLAEVTIFDNQLLGREEVANQ